jgi:hypothetical protein
MFFIAHSLAKMSVTMTTCHGSLGGVTTNRLVSLCCTTPQGTKASATTVQSAFATTIIHSFHGSFTLAINVWDNKYLLAPCVV